MTTPCAEPLPGTTGHACELAAQHDGWHRTGPVRWGGGSEVDDGKHDDAGGDF